MESYILATAVLNLFALIGFYVLFATWFSGEQGPIGGEFDDQEFSEHPLDRLQRRGDLPPAWSTSIRLFHKKNASLLHAALPAILLETCAYRNQLVALEEQSSAGVERLASLRESVARRLTEFEFASEQLATLGDSTAQVSQWSSELIQALDQEAACVEACAAKLSAWDVTEDESEQRLGWEIQALLAGAHHVRNVAGDLLTRAADPATLPSSLASEPTLAARYELKTLLGGASASKESQPRTLALLDVDGFEKLNSQFGAGATDAFIDKYLDLLRGECGDSLVFAAAIGGATYAFVFDEPDVDAAAAVVERLRQRSEATTFDFGGQTLKVTCSGGVVRHDAGHTAVESLELLVNSVRTAKRSGRNQVHVITEGGVAAVERGELPGEGSVVSVAPEQAAREASLHAAGH